MSNELFRSDMGKAGADVLQDLVAHGYEAYFVGGCVRDSLLGRQVKDIDIATSATPEEVTACFVRTVPTGLRHGTVTVVDGGYAFEVTTFRTESEYDDFRRPTSVQYVKSLAEDLKRRDFTMNAMAMDKNGDLIDPHGGRQDLGSGLLRSVGKAEARFREDALRMLRCVRFAAEYGLEIEAGTWNALREHAPLLTHIAMERVRQELERLVAGADPSRGIRLLVDSELLRYFRQDIGLPMLAAWSGPFAERALPRLNALGDASARWTLLLLLTEEGAGAARAALRRLTFARAAGEAVTAALAVHEGVAAGLAQPAGLGAAGGAHAPAERLAAALKRAAVAHGADAARRWAAAFGALAGASSGHAAPPLAAFAAAYAPLVAAHAEAWLAAMPCVSLRELALGGTELIAALGVPGGPWVSETLRSLLEDVALGSLPNERSALLAAAASKITPIKGSEE